MRAVIVASGPSGQGFELPPGVVVIAVNGAIDWLPRVDHWFTLDPSEANLRRMASPRDGVVYHAALPSSHPAVGGHVRRYQRVAARGPEPADKNSPYWWLWRWSAVCGLSATSGRIHTGNSAWGALQLAHHLGATKVALVGVDASSEPRIEGGRPGNLSHLPLLFDSALGRINFINCGRMPSRAPRMSIAEGMQWLTQ